MISNSLKIEIKKVLEKEAIRRVSAIKDKPNNGLFVNTNALGALDSLPEDAFIGIFPQVSQFGVSETELEEFLKWACQEINEKYGGAIVNPFRPLHY